MELQSRSISTQESIIPCARRQPVGYDISGGALIEWQRKRGSITTRCA